MLCQNTEGCYFIVHAGVYQGKNAKNVGIPVEIQKLLTTIKAVVNTVIQSKIGNDPNGMRRLFCDNRYSCTHLFIILREQYQILCAGSTRKNRIGWPKALMNMPNNADRGTNKVLYDYGNRVLVIQWKNNKIVNCINNGYLRA